MTAPPPEPWCYADPPGSGKSRVVDQLHRERMHDSEWVFVRCADFVERGPAAAVRSITQRLHRMRAARTTLDPEREVPTLPADADEDDTAPVHAWLEALADSVATLLRDLAHDRPLVFVLDRLDLADSATLTLLEGIAAGVVGADVVLLTTTHSPLPDLWRDRALVIELPALSLDDCHELVQLLLDGQEIEPDTLEVLVRASRGLPGPLTEVVHVALDTGQLRLTGGATCCRLHSTSGRHSGCGPACRRSSIAWHTTTNACCACAR